MNKIKTDKLDLIEALLCNKGSLHTLQPSGHICIESYSDKDNNYFINLFEKNNIEHYQLLTKEQSLNSYLIIIL